jgi:hypothetical protein
MSAVIVDLGRTDYGCPDWCERHDHDGDVIETTDDVRHYGPQFGKFIGTEASGQGAPSGWLDDYSERALNQLSAADLRQLAGDALAAAEWLEGAQS